MVKTLKVNICELETNLFVRNRLDQEWALSLALLIENGQKLAPIKITSNDFYPDIEKKWLVVDGRHRIEAHEINSLNEMECEVIHVKDECDLIAIAYRSNLGGSLPPRREDTEHTIRLLMSRGASPKSIGEVLGLPPGVARKYLADVRSKDNRAKEMRAVSAVTDGHMSIAKAAEEHGVDEDRLREIFGSRGKKHKKGIEETQRLLTQGHKSMGLRNASLLRSVLEKYEDGEVTVVQVNAIFTHLDELHKRAARSLGDWKKRFAALNGGEKKPRSETKKAA